MASDNEEQKAPGSPGVRIDLTEEEDVSQAAAAPGLGYRVQVLGPDRRVIKSGTREAPIPDPSENEVQVLRQRALASLPNENKLTTRQSSTRRWRKCPTPNMRTTKAFFSLSLMLVGDIIVASSIVLIFGLVSTVLFRVQSRRLQIR